MLYRKAFYFTLLFYFTLTLSALLASLLFATKKNEIIRDVRLDIFSTENLDKFKDAPSKSFQRNKKKSQIVNSVEKSQVQTPTQPINIAPQATNISPQPIPVQPVVSQPQPHHLNTPITSTQKKPESDFVQLNISKIREVIQKNTTYPQMATRLSLEGISLVSFRLLPSGEVIDIKVVGSSGSSLLDKNSIRIIQDCAKEFPKPQNEAVLVIPIEYKLN